MTVTQVLGCGIEKGTKEYEVDENYEMELLPKQQIAIVVEKEKVPEIVELIKQELNKLSCVPRPGRRSHRSHFYRSDGDRMSFEYDHSGFPV